MLFILRQLGHALPEPHQHLVGLDPAVGIEVGATR
jgi:hypothetical protein